MGHGHVTESRSIVIIIGGCDYRDACEKRLVTERVELATSESCVICDCTSAIRTSEIILSQSDGNECNSKTTHSVNSDFD